MVFSHSGSPPKKRSHPRLYPVWAANRCFCFRFQLKAGQLHDGMGARVSVRCNYSRRTGPTTDRGEHVRITLRCGIGPAGSIRPFHKRPNPILEAEQRN